MAAPFTASVLDSFTRTAENPLSDSDAWAGGWHGGVMKTNGTQALSTVADRQFAGGIWGSSVALPAEIYVTLAAFGGQDVAYIGWLDDSADPVYGYVLTVQAEMESAPKCQWSINDLCGGECTVNAGDSIGMLISAAGLVSAYTEHSGVWTLLGSATDKTYDTGTFFPGPGYPAVGTLSGGVRFTNFGAGSP